MGEEVGEDEDEEDLFTHNDLPDLKKTRTMKKRRKMSN
jgi:hypothetical protein